MADFKPLQKQTLGPVSATDRRGNPATFDGDPVWASDNEAVATVEVDAAQSRAMLSEILGSLYFGSDDLHWTLDPFVYTYAVLTDAGRLAGKEVLGERGYRWWYYEDDEGTT